MLKYVKQNIHNHIMLVLEPLEFFTINNMFSNGGQICLVTHWTNFANWEYWDPELILKDIMILHRRYVLAKPIYRDR